MLLHLPFHARFSASHLQIALLRGGCGPPPGPPLGLPLGRALRRTLRDVRSGRGWRRRVAPLRQVSQLTRGRLATILHRIEIAVFCPCSIPAVTCTARREYDDFTTVGCLQIFVALCKCGNRGRTSQPAPHHSQTSCLLFLSYIRFTEHPPSSRCTVKLARASGAPSDESAPDRS